MGYLYSVATGVANFPSPPTGMTPPLPFTGSDDTIEVPFPPGRSFTFFDVTYTSMCSESGILGMSSRSIQDLNVQLTSPKPFF